MAEDLEGKIASEWMSEGNQNDPLSKWLAKKDNKLLTEIQKLKNDLNLLTDDKILEKNRRLVLYKEFLKAMIAEPTLNVQEINGLDRYRRQMQISKEDHIVTINALGYTTNEFEKLKNWNDSGANYDEDCIICYDKPKEMMFTPCNHICICKGCASHNFSFEWFNVCDNHQLLTLVHGYIRLNYERSGDGYFTLEVVSQVVRYCKLKAKKINCPMCSASVKSVVEVHFK